jgi:hypothetical protein
MGYYIPAAAGQANNRLPTRPRAPPVSTPLQVIAQCQQCDAWHKLADAANLVEEIRYADLLDDEEEEAEAEGTGSS